MKTHVLMGYAASKMKFTQLNPQIPMITEKGDGQAIAVIDYSEEHHLLWVVALDETGEIWTIPNPKVKLFPNYSIGRKGIKSEN